VPVYLGFDCATQGLTAIAIEVGGAERRRVLLQRSLRFDDALPAYGTVDGVLPDADPLVVRSSPLMWAEALDTLMGVVVAELGDDVRRIVAVSGSAQQHGSVYLRAEADAVLARLHPARPLADQLRDAFSVETAPVWMDASTSAQCAAITRALGGPDAVARLTGSRAFERFTGPQIRKLHETDPAAYARTARIHLVSSYLASLLAGASMPVDTGDASGTNLMDLRRGGWADAALEATAPGLRDRLPPVVPPATVVGRLSPWWTARHGLPPAKLVAWTGDNPSSLVGVGVVEPGTVAVSLGTSDTLFTVMDRFEPDPSGTAHVFGAPTGDFMSLVCFRNGSLARERVRDRFGLDWDGFSHLLDATSPGNGGALMLPWFEPEITPRVDTPGVHRLRLAEDDAGANVRGVVEGQMLAMRAHSRWTASRVERIHATGGAARNTALLQVMADVFAAPVHRIDVANSACLGAALRAVHADAASRGRTTSWDDVLAGFAEPNPSLAVRPRPAAVAVYHRLESAWVELEHRTLRKMR
jgi:xylulokinase